MLGVRAPPFLIGKVGTALGATALTAAGCWLLLSLLSHTLSAPAEWAMVFHSDRQDGRNIHARHSRLASAKRSLAPVWIMA